jgi:dTDP-glucose pyrophosphorylase
MAGEGKRFTQEGYTTAPKPLLDVCGKTVIERVLESIKLEGNFIFVVRKEHFIDYQLDIYLNHLKPNCKIITVDHVTEGAACTALLAKEFINTDEQLIICDSDSLVYFDSKLLNNYLMDAAILTFKSDKPCWSFVETNGNLQKIRKVEEKNPISDYASAGRYYWKQGKDFVHYAELMIERNLRVNNEFYVSPVYNLAIEDNKSVFNVLVDDFFNLGTPADLHEFIEKTSNHNL